VAATFGAGLRVEIPPDQVAQTGRLAMNSLPAVSESPTHRPMSLVGLTHHRAPAESPETVAP
jgi:hypothetical protein